MYDILYNIILHVFTKIIKLLVFSLSPTRPLIITAADSHNASSIYYFILLLTYTLQIFKICEICKSHDTSPKLG
jgi:hypothetical protein